MRDPFSNDSFLPPKDDDHFTNISMPVQTHSHRNPDDDDFLIFTKLLNRHYIYGGWETMGRHTIPNFDHVNGYMFMLFDQLAKYAIDLHIYDGRYVDKGVMTVMFNHKGESKHFNKTNSTLRLWDVEVTYQIGRAYGDLGLPETCKSDISIYFINKNTLKPFIINETEHIDSKNLAVQVRFKSKDGPLHLITSVLTRDDPLFDSQALPYVIMISLMAITECFVLYFFDLSVCKKPYLARRTSSWSLVVLNAFDLYFFLSTSYFFMSYSPWYELCTIPCAFLAFCFGPKVTWSILQIQKETENPPGRLNPEVKTYFCMLLLFLGVLGSLVLLPELAYLFSVLFLMPQIIHNTSHSLKYRWNYWIIGGLTFPKILYTLYTKVDEDNLLRISPNIYVVIIYFSLLSIQILLLAIQTRWPKFGWEKKDIYSVYSTKASRTQQDLCAICLEKLKDSFANSSPSSSLIQTDTTLKDRRKVLTPCNHEFHLVCLSKWLDSKLECPYCRKHLPFLPDDCYDD